MCAIYSPGIDVDKTAEAWTKNKQIRKQGKNRSACQPTTIDFLGFDMPFVHYCVDDRSKFNAINWSTVKNWLET